MPNEDGILQGLADFSFQKSVTLQLVKWLYGIALLAGVVALVVGVYSGLQQSPAQGLLVLVFGLIGLGIWVLLVRVALEIVVAILQMGQNIERSVRGLNA